MKKNILLLATAGAVSVIKAGKLACNQESVEVKTDQIADISNEEMV